jgi:signal transduction histidine kinase
MDRRGRTSLTIIVSLFVFCMLCAAIGLAVLGVYILEWTGVMAGAVAEMDMGAIVLFMSVISLILGWVLVLLLIRIPLKPIHTLIIRMNRLAKGDFKARIDEKGILANYPAIRDMNQSFNKLAEELEHTEMLRSDFINNFSHEFKTPIVSIAGFAKLLKRGTLTDEQRVAYLTSIEEESMRLSYMATNVLNLTKIENQTILTDVTTFNLSEQVRSAVLLLESKWSEKDIDLQLDFDEHTVEGNEELLKQVWINLIDNAIKFTHRLGTVIMDVTEGGDTVTVAVSNTGVEIPPERMDKIFNKFYQADESHATEGNGIGLAIVKRVVELHRGHITVTSERGMTTFRVALPKKNK